MSFMKIIKIIIICFLLIMAQQVFAGMDSDDYQIWLDTLSPGGGRVNSDSYTIDSNITINTGNLSSSTNFSETSAFSGIEDEPTVGFDVQTVTLNFGELSPNSTAYSSHIFSAYTNSTAGYTIRVYGQPLHNSYHTITPIGSVLQDPSAGTEQFGINLVSNSVPIVGADPTGGIGQAAINYNVANKYAYQEGEVIAQAASFSYQTDYTVSVIVNISDETPAGSYGTTLTYEFIPVF